MVARRMLSISRILLPMLVLAAVPLLAQPSNTCDGNELLAGTEMVPWSGFLPPTSLTDTFDMSAPSCFDQTGADMVVCFTPQNDCTVNLTSTQPTGTTGINLFLGPCNTKPATCLARDSFPAGTAGIFNASLTAGVQYCVVCSNNLNQLGIQLSISAAQGECGALPVELQHFSID